MVYRYLCSCDESGVTKDDLRQILCPPALQSGLANDVINEAHRLGIIDTTPAGSYRLASELRQVPNTSFLDWLEARLLDPDHAERVGQANFPYALAWFLEQDPAEPFEFGDNITGLIAEQCGPDAAAFEMSNRARSQNFVYWAQYLGYAWRLSVGNYEAIMPDPTRAIERHLSHLLKETGELLMEDLLDAWAIRCPVLEGGTARLQVTELCRSHIPRDPKLLSRSTSTALLRLEQRGVVKLERRADAAAYTLNTRPNPRPVSHVIWQIEG